jgi:hypothetical protein
MVDAFHRQPQRKRSGIHQPIEPGPPRAPEHGFFEKMIPLSWLLRFIVHGKDNRQNNENDLGSIHRTRRYLPNTNVGPCGAGKELDMRRNIFAVPAVGIFLLGFSTVSGAQEKATPMEVVQKVQEAAKSLAQSGEAGLAQFDKTESPWVWKDSYVFVADCGNGTIAAHPFRPDLIGKDDRELKGTKGTELFPKLCEATKTPAGVWVEYWWPKPNEKEGSRKISYALRVSNTPYIVGAGVYDDKATVAELQKLTSPGK